MNANPVWTPPPPAAPTSLMLVRATRGPVLLIILGSTDKRALQGMAQRRPVAAEIGTAGRLLADHFDRFSADFDEFLPELRVRCAEFLAERDAN